MLSAPKGSLETQREAWKERHDARNWFAKDPSGKTYETLKRAEAWFDAVAFAESFPVARPSYPSETYFLEQENLRLRGLIADQLVSARKEAEKAANLRATIRQQEQMYGTMRSLNFKKQMEELDHQIAANRAELKTLERAEQRFISMQKYDVNSKTQYMGDFKKLWKENRDLEMIRKGTVKRAKINCMVCNVVEARYIWDGTYLVCSQECANTI